jgi:hypothetical protein
MDPGSGQRRKRYLSITRSQCPLENLLILNLQVRSARRPGASNFSPKPVSSQISSSGAADRRADWDRLSLWPPNLLKGKLKFNTSVSIPFSTAAGNLSQGEHNQIGSLIAALFAVRTSPAFDGWEITDSYCEPCLLKFLEEHAWVWFLEEEVKSAFFFSFPFPPPFGRGAHAITEGWVPPENCWCVLFPHLFPDLIPRRYGYNCNTQTHKATHAQQKNARPFTFHFSPCTLFMVMLM